MGIVEKAQAEAEETSGALQGGNTAAFLSGEDEVVEEGSSLIEALESDAPAPESRVVERVTTTAESTNESDVADDAVLEDLLEDKPEAEAGTEKTSTDMPEAPEGHDSGMIDDLLGGDDPKDRNS